MGKIFTPQEALSGGNLRRFEKEEPTVVTPEEAGGTFQRVSEFVAPEITQEQPQARLEGVKGTAQDVSVGVAKGLGSTLFGAGKLGEKILRGTVGKVKEFITGREQGEATFQEKPEILEPQGSAEKAGFLAEQIAEFLIPVGTLTKVEKAAAGAVKGTGALAKAARVGTRAGIEAAAVGGQTALQKGEVENEAKSAALIAGLFPVAGAIAEKPLGKLATKIEDVVIKPTKADIRGGFKTSNVFKYDLGGSLKQVLNKSQNKLNAFAKRLDGVIDDVNTQGFTTNVDLLSAAQRAENKIARAKQFGQIGKIRKQFKNIRDEIAEVANEAGASDFKTAIMVKRGAGRQGAWAYKYPDPDASAIEQAYTAFYNELKTTTEKVAERTQRPEFIQLNKAISDIIPIQSAALRRLPVASRNQVLGLKAPILLMGSLFEPNALALLGVDKILQSGRFANYLAKTSQSTAPALTPRVVSAINQPETQGTEGEIPQE